MKTSLEDLVARCIEALEHGDPAEVDALCEAHPEHATAMQRQLARLKSSGLLSASELIEIPDQVGPYRIVRPLGRGGMGSVFLAEQSKPVQRQVALKVIKLGMDSREVLARFERERQVLARMNHPHIATVYETGLTEQGRPYFAMEYVPGEPITSYADRHQLTTAQRVALLVPVCEAVQHAHQKGIIHRDLKPTNVLVTELDGAPVAKVIDFGVAKALDYADCDDGQLTEHGRLLGTPEYMSPEQAGEVSGDVDTRTDVYALGVLLYELLTGVLPLDARSLRAAGNAEMRRLIRELDPPTPSARVSTLSDKTGPVASARRTTPDGLRRQLRGELDWIVLRAMAKERDRRYPTVLALSEDLVRQLKGEAVAAVPPSAWYRLRKSLRRHRLAVGAAVVLLAGAGVAVCGIAFGLERARHEARVAAADFQDALDTVDTLLVLAAQERLAGVPRATELEVAFREQALAAYRRLLLRRPQDPDLCLRAARGELELGLGYKALGKRVDAHQHVGAAHRELRALAQQHPEDVEVALALATACAHLVNLHGLDERFEDVEAAYQESRGVLEQLMRRDPDTPEYVRLLAHLHEDRGGHAEVAGDVERKTQLTQAALGLREQLHARWPEDVRYRSDLGDSYSTLAVMYGRAGDMVLALEYARRACALIRELLAEQPARWELRRLLAGRLNVLGNLERDGDQAASLATHREAAALYDELVADYPHRAELHYLRAQPRYGLAFTHVRRCRDHPEELAEVVRLASEGAASNRRALEHHNDRTEYTNLQRMLLQVWILGLRTQGTEVPAAVHEEWASLPENGLTRSHLQAHRRALRKVRNAR